MAIPKSYFVVKELRFYLWNRMGHFAYALWPGSAQMGSENLPMNGRTLQILVGDEHPVFRRGIRDLLYEHFAPVDVEEVTSGSDMVLLAQRKPWDLFIMDVKMTGKSGTELLQDLRRIRPSTPVLAISNYSEQTYAVRMIRAGASAYLTKCSTPEVLIAAVKTILSGHKYIGQEVAECLAASIQVGTTKPPHDLLSNREFQILQMLVMGKPLKAIAGELCVSPNTISTYRTRVLDKLQVKSNTELARYAIENHLID
jgi:two-component system invasion response regulator UvrY